MARDPNVARLPQNPKISVGLTWEKEKEGERGRLVFSDLKYEPITIEVDELKGTHQPLIRVMYYRGDHETACCIRPKERLPLNAQGVMNGIRVNVVEMSSADRTPDVFSMIFYKAMEYIRRSEFYNQTQPGDLLSVAAKLSTWAEDVYKKHGVNYEARGIYDHSTGRLMPVKAGDSLIIDDLNRRAPVSYRQLIMTPGVIPDLDVHDTILYCVARKVSLDDIAFFVSLPKSKVKEIIGESLLKEKKTRTLDENESKLYPRGTIFSTIHPGPRPHVAYWQVVRCTKRTLWMQELQAAGDRQTGRYLPVRDTMKNDAIYECRINLKAAVGAPIRIDGDIATIWARKVFTEDAHRTV